jgi:hypothetical protein
MNTKLSTSLVAVTLLGLTWTAAQAAPVHPVASFNSYRPAPSYAYHQDIRPISSTPVVIPGIRPQAPVIRYHPVGNDWGHHVGVWGVSGSTVVLSTTDTQDSAPTTSDPTQAAGSSTPSNQPAPSNDPNGQSVTLVGEVLGRTDDGLGYLFSDGTIQLELQTSDYMPLTTKLVVVGQYDGKSAVNLAHWYYVSTAAPSAQ